MQDAILRMKQTIETTGISRTSIYAKITPQSKYYDPLFPKPLKLGTRSIGFRASEVSAWKDGLQRVA